MTSIVKSIVVDEVGVDQNLYLTATKGIKVPEVWVGPSGSETQWTSGGGAGVNWPTAGQVVISSGGTSDPTGSTTAYTNADGTLNILSEVINETGTGRTLALTDGNAIVSSTNASTQTFTIPTNATAAFPVNTVIQFEQNGAGVVTIAAAGGVTLNGNASSTSQYTSFYIRKTAINTWVTEGLASGSGSGTVTTVSVASSNGFTGTVANATTAPAITLTTSITGVLKGNGTAISAASAGTDYAGLGNTQTFSAKQTYSAGQYVSGGAIEEAVYSNGNSGTSLAVNLDNGNLQSVTITGAVAITQTTPTHPGKYTLVITQDGTGHVYSLSGIKWAAGAAPTYSTAANKIDVISIIYDGTNYYGMGGIAFS